MFNAILFRFLTLLLSVLFAKGFFFFWGGGGVCLIVCLFFINECHVDQSNQSCSSGQPSYMAQTLTLDITCNFSTKFFHTYHAYRHH